MPKLLTQVWKTFFGSFFESEEEAADAELQWKVDAAITSAWKAAMAPIIEKDRVARAAYDARGVTSRRDGMSPPFAEAMRYGMPESFQLELIASLKTNGVLAPVTLSGGAQ